MLTKKEQSQETLINDLLEWVRELKQEVRTLKDKIKELEKKDVSTMRS